MRTASDDSSLAVPDDRSDAGFDTAAPERRCVLTGTHGGRDRLIRLALGPDGRVWPDLGAKLDGRGAWIGVDRPALEAAQAKGKLKAALARAFKVAADVPADLPQRLADSLERRALDRLGLEHRAGHLVFGSERIGEHARGGRLSLLLHAADAAGDGVGKLDQALRVGREDLPDISAAATTLRLPAGRDSLSRALGRDNIVHIGVTDGKAAARIATDVLRWLAYLGPATLGSDETMIAGRDLPDRRSDEGRE